MLRSQLLARPARTLVFSRTYATATSPHALVFLEHREGSIDSSSLSALTAANQLGGKVTGLIIGAPDEVKQAVEKAKKSVFFLRITLKIAYGVHLKLTS